MAESIGKQLKQARLRRGWSIEDIVHETRIPEDNVRKLEEDNYSDFASPTYARSFLSIYSGCLEVDASEIIEAMGSSKGSGPEGAVDSLLPSIDLTPQNQTIPIFKGVRERKDRSSIGLFVAIVLLIFSVPSFFLLGRYGANELHAAEMAIQRERIIAETRAEFEEELNDGAAPRSTLLPPEFPSGPQLSPEDAALNEQLGIPTTMGTPPASSTLTPSLINPAAPPVTIIQPGAEESANNPN